MTVTGVSSARAVPMAFVPWPPRPIERPAESGREADLAGRRFQKQTRTPRASAMISAKPRRRSSSAPFFMSSQPVPPRSCSSATQAAATRSPAARSPSARTKLLCACPARQNRVLQSPVVSGVESVPRLVTWVPQRQHDAWLFVPQCASTARTMSVFFQPDELAARAAVHRPLEPPRPPRSVKR